MKCVIHWDAQTTRASSDKYDLTVTTGASILLRNRLTVLTLRDARQGVAADKAIMRQLQSLADTNPATRAEPGAPEVHHFTGAGNMLPFVAVLGIVLNGSRRGKLLQGEFRFVVIAPEQLDDCLQTVFKVKLEKVS